MGVVDQKNSKTPKKETNRNEQKAGLTKNNKERVVWGVMSSDEMKRPGAALIQLIFQMAHNRNLKSADVCDALQVTYGYFTSLRSGIKLISHIGEEFIERIALFLRLPKIAVKLAAGQIRIEDFYYNGDEIQSQLKAALRLIISIHIMAQNFHYPYFQRTEIFKYLLYLYMRMLQVKLY